MAQTDTTDVPMDPSVDYEIGQDNIQTSVGPFGLDIHNPVFLVSGLGVIAFVLGALMFPDGSTSAFNGLRNWLTGSFDWFFLIAGNIFVLFCLLLIVTPVGSVRLGGKDARPDYGYPGWFAILFAAGMGIGLMFFGVSEPLSHYGTSVAEGAGGPGSWAPLGGAAGDPEAAARLGMAATIYHWGLHPLWRSSPTIAACRSRSARRSTRSSAIGSGVWGPVGHVIDVVAVFATLFGLATSLGFGADARRAQGHRADVSV